MRARRIVSSPRIFSYAAVVTASAAAYGRVRDNLQVADVGYLKTGSRSKHYLINCFSPGFVNEDSEFFISHRLAWLL